MDRELCTYKTASPAEGLPTAANFHIQVINNHSNKNHYGETFILAFIPGEMHQRVFERAVVSFEDHYYRAEIEDDNFKRFSRSIRAINTGMEEIRQYYKVHRQAYNYSFCILTVTESDFLLSACGLSHVIAEDTSNRLHEVYVPEEFLEFSEIITGSHQDLNHLFLCLTDTNHPLLSSVIEQIAYSILLATKGRIQSPYLNMMVNFQTTPSTLSSNKTAVSALGIFTKTSNHFKKQYKAVKSRILSRRNTKNQTPNIQQQKTKPARKISHRIQTLWTKLWSTYINPNPLRALIVVGGVVALLIVGIIAWNIFGSNNKTSTQYQKIQSLYSNAQTSKTNQDVTNSETQFKQVLSEISQLSNAEKTALNKYASSHNQPSLEDMSKNSQIQLDEMHNIFRVSAAKTFSETNFSYSLISSSASQLNLLNPSNGKLLGYTTSNQKSTSKNQTSLIDSKWLVSSIDTPLTYAISQKSVFQIKPDLSAVEARTSATSWPNAQAAATYAGNLYFLMPSAGQIYRFRSVGSNQFGPQTNYLKTVDSSLNDAVSFVVNTTIYTTSKTGSIHQYSQNSLQSFTTTGLPTLTDVIQIAYRATPESLILLDTKQNSFTILSVQGNAATFQRELIVNNTTDISNFTVDEKNSLLYFVSKDGLYSLPLP